MVEFRVWVRVRVRLPLYSLGFSFTEYIHAVGVSLHHLFSFFKFLLRFHPLGVCPPPTEGAGVLFIVEFNP